MVLRKVQCRLERLEAGRLAIDVKCLRNHEKTINHYYSCPDAGGYFAIPSQIWKKFGDCKILILKILFQLHMILISTLICSLNYQSLPENLNPYYRYDTIKTYHKISSCSHKLIEIMLSLPLFGCPEHWYPLWPWPSAAGSFRPN